MKTKEIEDAVLVSHSHPVYVLSHAHSVLETDDNTASQPPVAQNFPFATEADDHCETPKEAYADILPLLIRVAELVVGKESKQQNQQQLRIYDPYYCDGAVVRNLAELGFSNVRNDNEDCYEVWGSLGKDTRFCDTFDVLVTNPPYSSDHIERLLDFVTSQSKYGARPWFLLLPNFVHKKDYFVKATSKIHPFFLVPRKRYVYLPPKNFRESKKSDVHKKSSPFVSMWYCWGGTPARNEELIRHFYSTSSCSSGPPSCDLARSKSALRDLRRKKR